MGGFRNVFLSYLWFKDLSQGVIIDNFKRVLYIGLVFAFTILVATSVNLWFSLNIQKKIDNEDDPTNYKFLRYVVVVGIYFIGIMFCLLAFSSLKGIAQTALGGAGVIAIITGLAAQEALANII